MKATQQPEEDYFSAEEELQDEDLPFSWCTLELLAKGGFATVYTCKHKALQIPLVVKITELTEGDDNEDEDLWEAYDTELQFYEATWGRPDISWLPTLYGSGFTKFCGTQSPWIALEKLHGCLLSLNGRGEIASQFRHIALGALNALECLHAEGFIHRDIKLDNFAVRKHAVSGNLEVCLIDFGLLMPYRALDREGEDDKMEYTGTFEYSSDRQLQERMVGPADDLESLGYGILELFIGETWWQWEQITKIKKKKLKKKKKLAEENLPTRHHQKRGRDAQHAQQEPELPLLSANDRPRHKARGLKGVEEQKEEEQKGEEPVFEARIVLAPPASAPAAAPLNGDAPYAALAVDNDAEYMQEIKARKEQCLRMINRRNKVWARLDKQGKIPDFLKEYMKYCKSLTAYDSPDYDKLRNLLKQAPEVAHIAQALHNKQPAALQKED